MNQAYKAARKLIIAIVGFSIICVGLALLVLPGPGIAVIALGLFVLSLEFAWADRYFQKIKVELDKLVVKLKRTFRR